MMIVRIKFLKWSFVTPSSLSNGSKSEVIMYAIGIAEIKATIKDLKL